MCLCVALSLSEVVDFCLWQQFKYIYIFDDDDRICDETCEVIIQRVFARCWCERRDVSRTDNVRYGGTDVCGAFRFCADHTGIHYRDWCDHFALYVPRMALGARVPSVAGEGGRKVGQYYHGGAGDDGKREHCATRHDCGHCRRKQYNASRRRTGSDSSRPILLG